MAGMEAAVETGRPTNDSIGILCRHTSHAALTVRAQVARDRFAIGLGQALQELRRTAAGAGTALREIPFIAYHGLTAESVDLEVGLLVGDSTRAADGELTTVPMGRYASIAVPLETGAVTDAYAALARWFTQHAEHGAGPVYTTVTVEADAKQDRILIQRRSCAGHELGDDGNPGGVPLGKQAAELATLGCELLARDAGAREPRAAGRALDPLRALGLGARVADVMSTPVVSCQRGESLAAAAQRMWEHDIGALPVLDADAQPIAVITDRDICMAAYTQGRRLSDIPVGGAMSRALYVCHPEDALSAAEQQMAAHQVRRLPVTDARGELVGLLSLGDVVLARTRTTLSALMERATGEVTTTLAEITRHRSEASKHN